MGRTVTKTLYERIVGSLVMEELDEVLSSEGMPSYIGGMNFTKMKEQVVRNELTYKTAVLRTIHRRFKIHIKP